MSERPTTRERLGQNNPGKFVRYFVLVMAIVYIALGLYLLLAKVSAIPLAATPRRILGAVFVFYGIIRFVRNYREATSPSHDE